MNSKELFEKSKELIPGGVNSPVRAFRNVGGTPFFVRKADGAKLYSVDGNTYFDFVCTWGPALFGHNNPRIREAVVKAAENGTSFGTPCQAEYEMAKLITDMIPCAQMVRMTNSGTEATMSCVRLARGYTGRNRIVKFAGCYHGHVDSLLVKAGSGALTFGNPDSAGIPADLAKLTSVLEYNDIPSLEEYFSKYGNETAAVIVEPYPANTGLILPQNGFLKALREITKKYGALLIFDEVITGFRIAEGGAQQKEGIMPDLCALGKIIGGGLPVGAFAGRRDIMEYLAPLGPVYQAGTLSGNPLAMAAGKTALEMILEEKPYARLQKNTDFITDAISGFARERGVPLQIPKTCGLFGLYFSEDRVDNFSQAMKCSVENYRKFFNGCLKRGVYFAPSPYESCFLSMSHEEKELESCAEIIEEVFRKEF